MTRHRGFALTLILIGVTTGCGTTRFSDSTRTATEMLLISDAVDQAVSEMDFHALSGKKVYFDPSFLECKTDKGYVVSSIRQHLLANGCLLMEKREDADYVVEARCGGLGTDRYDLLFGIPQMQLPAIMPGTPTSIPEIPFAKRTEQKGVAKLAVFAYNRRTGRPVWQSGIIQKDSLSNNLWVLGAGPFRSGSLHKRTEFAGQRIEIPFITGDNSDDELTTSIPVTQPAVWIDPRIESQAAGDVKEGKKNKK